MIALVRFFLSLVGLLLNPKLRLAAENAALAAEPLQGLFSLGCKKAWQTRLNENRQHNEVAMIISVLIVQRLMLLTY